METRNNKGTYSQKHIDLNHKSSLEQGLRIVKAWAVNNPCGRGAHARLLLESWFGRFVVGGPVLSLRCSHLGDISLL